MKLFSRKSLVAAATSAALVSGVLIAPANAETVQDDPTTTVTTPENDDTENDDAENELPAEPEPEDGSSEFFSGSSDDNGNLDPAELRNWIAVFTAIIGALSTVFVFAEKNL